MITQLDIGVPSLLYSKVVVGVQAGAAIHAMICGRGCRDRTGAGQSPENRVRLAAPKWPTIDSEQRGKAYEVVKGTL